jgi:hypothetical protein
MPQIQITDITDTLNNVTQQFGGETPYSELNPIPDAQMRRRTIIRVVIVLVIVGIIGYLIFKTKKK